MTSTDVLGRLPAESGHFLLESGCHTDLWLTLDALFVSPRDLAPLVGELAGRLRPHDVSAVCGPLLGGAFLALALATEMGVDFTFTERAPRRSTHLFSAQYDLPAALHPHVRGQRIALVDEVISAGSSVRASAAALTAAGASIAVVGALTLLGTKALDHFAGLKIPVETLARRDFALWEPSGCPLCAAGVPLDGERLR